MIEWPFLVVAGLLGSSHCLGMCGPFALAIGSSSRSWSANGIRQTLYTAGRIFTYAVLGAAAGYGGSRLAHVAPALLNIPAILALIAGMFLCWQGLAAAGVIRRSPHQAGTPCLATIFFGSFLRRPGAGGVFLAGVFTGLLPCGLLYGMVALAASTHVLWKGIAVMTLFGLGTAPAMIAAGWSGSLVSVTIRRHAMTAAAWCLVVTGAISVVRGANILLADDRSAGAAACPLCK